MPLRCFTHPRLLLLFLALLCMVSKGGAQSTEGVPRYQAYALAFNQSSKTPSELRIPLCLTFGKQVKPYFLWGVRLPISFAANAGFSASLNAQIMGRYLLRLEQQPFLMPFAEARVGLGVITISRYSNSPTQTAAAFNTGMPAAFALGAMVQIGPRWGAEASATFSNAFRNPILEVAIYRTLRTKASDFAR